MTELNLDFPVLRDSNNEIATAFGLTLETPPPVIEAERFLGLDLPDHNGTDHWDLPIPARYILDTTGKILYSALHVDHRFRTEPSDCVQSMVAVK